MNLRVLTLNVWGLPLGISRHSEARMQAIAQRLETLDADVVALQEVWTGGARSLLGRAGRALGYNTVWHRDRTFGGSGLMVLSRLPEISAEFTSYRLTGLPQRPQHADYYGGKGFVELVLKTPHGPLSLINTHLHAGYEPPGQPDEYVGIRAAQAIQLANSVRNIHNPVIAAGDFNSEEHEPAYRILLGLSGLEDAAATLGQRQSTITLENPYRSPSAPEARIDLILTRRGTNRSLRAVRIQRVLDEELAIDGGPGSYSDHAGVMVDLELERTDAPVTLPGPVLDSDLSLAREQLERGLAISHQRHKQENAYAGAGLGLALLGGATAWGAHRSRRQMVFRLMTALAGIGLLGASGAYCGSRWVSDDEAAGYREIAALLDRLQPPLPQRDTLPQS